MIRKPPNLSEIKDPLGQIILGDPAVLGTYISQYSQPIDSKGRYLPYDQIFYRAKEKKLDPELAWYFIKNSRANQAKAILPTQAYAGESCKFMLTPNIQKAISLTDRNTTKAAFEWMSGQVGEREQMQYLFSDLVEDEAISSSQLEGAATTTKVAKTMLSTERSPRTPDEKMIIGNYLLMRCAWDCRKKKLTPDLIAEFHQVGVEGINDDHYRPGVFRNSNDVVVEDRDGNTVHQPPKASGIKKRLKKLCEWVNTNHDDAESNRYIHPLIKAIALHFAIGYEHPFHDGNGRIARSLFYWYMFKMGFVAFRYISISILLKKAPVQYGNSYLHTEYDGMDMTYFIEYQCQIREKRSFENWLFNSGLYGQLAPKQRVVLQVATFGTQSLFTANNVKLNLGCSYNTAAGILNGLVDLGVFSKSKAGREWQYSLMNKKEIRAKWS